MKEKLGTYLEVPLGKRLRIYAAISNRKVQDVVGAALDEYLPSLADLVGDPNGALGEVRLQASTDLHAGIGNKPWAGI